MNRLTKTILAIAVVVGAVPVTAQQVRLPDYTDQQRWQRLGNLMVGWEAAIIALGESHGMTAEEVGAWTGEFFSQGWRSGQEASQFLTSMYRNHMSMPGATAEVISSTPTSVTARFNRPGDPLVAPTGYLGVEREQISVMFEHLNRVIAEWVGVGFDIRRDGGDDIVTLETQYGDEFRAGNQLRWNRSAYFNWLSSLQLLSLRMADGMTAREVGAADAAFYASTWTATTPWQLLRGMIWNQMSDPNAECEVLSASPEEVRARCVQHYRDVVNTNGPRFNVTVDDVFQSGRAFAEGVAEHLGMRWTETREDGHRMIVITRR